MSEVLIFTRTLPDGRQVHVFPLTFGRARIGVFTQEPFYDDTW